MKRLHDRVGLFRSYSTLSKTLVEYQMVVTTRHKEDKNSTRGGCVVVLQVAGKYWNYLYIGNSPKE
jgi:hypothetical protein